MAPDSSPRRRTSRMAKDARRAQVLATAQDLFAREGFHHVSMDDIAEAVEVSKPVLYRHFPSKLDLYLEIVENRGQSLVSTIDAALEVAAREPPSGRDVVRAVVRAYVDFVEDAGESFSLLFESDVTRDAAVRERVEQASDAAARAVCRGLRELAGLPVEHAELLSTALVGMARTAATHRYRTRSVSTDAAVESVTQLAWRGVAGLVRER
ncbi:TetR/AcrR family transcriptional regulator [Cellulomonas bogoriensis]|uniref:TetR family transcriptional regulator n=1 Tax=Cellulomonas bogoriensis 69B4 = DSM 16987 TaxID=1386082 RepID=A0A0A0BPU4_9CELL|nr:TetR/AcrR family transcriptional regulator [Cellulomonas bogoriensis]KGM09099.1 TetR family transcriptional regulator [Cellulomonas bogoriensis 69B4 = DSM 16987]